MYKHEMSNIMLERMNKENSPYYLETFNVDLYYHGWVVEINDGKIVACYIED